MCYAVIQLVTQVMYQICMLARKQFNLSQERDAAYACLLQKLSLSCVEWVLKDIYPTLKCGINMHVNHV